MKKANGFTLTELIASIVIIGILITIATPIYFGVSKNAKEEEYNSKKSYLESLATRYAEENNLSMTTKISVSRLIAAGYTGAEQYVDFDGDDLPFIENPKDEEDNLACRVIELSVENYDYVAVMTEESNCGFAIDDQNDVRMGIKAYQYLSDGTVGNPIGYESNSELNWTNTDVVIVVNPDFPTYNNLTINNGGVSKAVDVSKMLGANPSKGTKVDEETYSNIAIVSASVLAKQTVSVSLETEGTIKIGNILVKIDKEAPSIEVAGFVGWSSSKGTTAYLSDGSGSGAAGVYIASTDNRAELESSMNSNRNYFAADNDGAAYIDHIYIDGVRKELESKTYYLWGVDKAGNISPKAKAVEISNIDNTPPEIEGNVSIRSQISEYNSKNVYVKIVGSDGTGSGIVKACVYNQPTLPNKDACNWIAYGTSGVEVPYTIPGAEDGSGQTYSVYGFVQDAVGNVTTQGKESNKYTLYTKCSKTKTVDGTQCSALCNGGTFNLVGYDLYLDGIRCTQADKPAGGNACNVQDCCSKLNYQQTGTCSALCNGGRYYRYAYSAYDGRYCPDKNDWGGDACNTQGCCDAVNYAGYGECSAPCDGGTKVNPAYSAYNNQRCPQYDQSATCNTKGCCSKVTYEETKTCSKTCGGGKLKRKAYSKYKTNKRCKDKDDYNGSACNTQACASGDSGSSGGGTCCKQGHYTCGPYDGNGGYVGGCTCTYGQEPC